MPTVRFAGEEIECDRDDTLRDVLLGAGLSPHNGRAKALNCRGNGTCGTCAVRVEGPVSEPTARERRRLRFPPHDPDAGLRLSCQVNVEGDLVVEKFPGFWGQHVEEGDVGEVEETDETEAGKESGDANPGEPG